MSPPTHEGDFFYIKFQKQQQQEPSSVKNMKDVLEVKEQAFNNHTDSCKQFIPKIQDTVQVQKPKITKPMGVDDGFKGDAAACGASVVEVAHQMLAAKNQSTKLTRVDTEGNLVPNTSYLRTRRNSRSLPVSPMTSPGSSPLSRRKNNPSSSIGVNYLTADNIGGSNDAIDKKWGSSWILSSLFALKERKEPEKDGVNDMNVVAADSHPGKVVKHQPASSDATTKDSFNMTFDIKPLTPPTNPPNKGSVFKSKPHLRDLNLLTPSSM